MSTQNHQKQLGGPAGGKNAKMAALNNKLTNIYSNQTFAASVQGSNSMGNNIPNMSLQGRLAGGQAVPTRVHHG